MSGATSKAPCAGQLSTLPALEYDTAKRVYQYFEADGYVDRRQLEWVRRKLHQYVEMHTPKPRQEQPQQ